MIGSGLKKLAAGNGMKVSNGVAYGNLRGYAATLSEGAGWKQIAFSVMFTDVAQRGAFDVELDKVDLKGIYRVNRLIFSEKNIAVIFQDNPGTMKKIAEFLDWFIPLLDQYGATKMGICPECAGQITGGCWKLIDGVAHYMHPTCAENVRTQIAGVNEDRKQNAEGSYGTGLIGALLGAAIGAVVWAIVLNIGFVASIIGMLIGFLAEKGYNLLRGKQGKGKVAILIVAIVVGIVLGTFGAYAFSLVSVINEGETYLTYGDIPWFLMMLLVEDADFATSVVSNLLLGFLFAGLGVFALLHKTGKEVADMKFVDLD